MKKALLLGVLLVTALAWKVWQGGAPVDAPSGAINAVAATKAGAAGPERPGGKWFDALPGMEAAELKRVPLPPVDEGASAWLSMAEAREHGDPRTPPIVRDAEPRPAPTPDQLADPQAYQRYQDDQHARLLNNFVAAAATQLPRLQADLERGRAAGVSPEQLAKVEEKIARIRQLSDGIVRQGGRN